MNLTPVVTINPKSAGNGQCVFSDTQNWYAMIAKTVGGKEGSLFERYTLDANPKFIDSCFLPNAGHVTSSGIWHGYIWTTYQGRVVKFDYRSGTIKTSELQDVNTWSKSDSQISFSPTKTRAVVREHRGGYAYFRRYATDQLLAGVENQLGTTVKIKDSGSAVRQSFGMAKNSLFIGYGATDSKTWIEQWNFDTGVKVTSEDITAYAKAHSKESFEIECAAGSNIFLKVNRGSDRRYLIVKHDLEAQLGTPPVVPDASTLRDGTRGN